jgi:hypothetical protein
MTDMTDSQALDLLTAGGNLRVPCSRYGSDTFECAPVAVRVARILAVETGEPMTPESVEYVMGLVVNDHDDVQHFLDDYPVAH